VLPSGAQFSRFQVTGTKQGGTQELEPVEATGGTAELILPEGAWDVQVWAYNQADPVAIVAQAKNTLTNTGGEVTGNTRFVLEPTGTKPGGLAYRITKPEGSVRKVKERYAEYFRLGIEVLTGADNWEASLVDSKMPHEQIPEPDWTKISDKSAADWQAEAGIGDLPEAEKEKVIARMIADTNPKHFSASQGESLSPDKKHGEGIADSKESLPRYKHWKP
jgi:hypothetical protein